MAIEDIKELIKEWDNVAYNDVVPAVESGDYEGAESAATSLIEIDSSILRAINKAENAMGEK